MDMTVHVMANSLLYWTQSLYNEGLLKKIKLLETKYKTTLELKMRNEKGQLSFKFKNVAELNKLIKRLNES